jgi:hypothetical protein
VKAALGDKAGAIGTISRAQKKVADRRLFQITKRRRNDILFWLYEASLDCALGDIEYDSYVPPSLKNDIKCLPDGFLGDDKRLELCRKHYDQAMQTLENRAKGGGMAAPVQAANGGQGGQGNARAGVDRADWRVRMAAKACMSIGRVLRLSAARKTSDSERQMILRQAQSYYEQAEQRYRTRAMWNDIISPDTKYPLTLKAFEEFKSSRKDVSATALNSAELSASLAAESDDEEERAQRIDETDDSYNKVSDLCGENFKSGHPIAHWVRLSQAKFFWALYQNDERDVLALELQTKKDPGDKQAAMSLAQARNRATARRRNVEWRLGEIRKKMGMQLPQRHPLILTAALLEMEVVAASAGKEREQKINKLCEEIREIANLRDPRLGEEDDDKQNDDGEERAQKDSTQT